MALTKEQKRERSGELAKQLQDSGYVYFTQYQGLKFQDIDELRKKLRPLGARYRVLKNSLMSHALKGAGLSVSDEGSLEGPNALLTGPDDPVGPAKVLVQFAKDFESLKIKGGIVGGRWLSAAECKRLAALGTKPELLAKLAGGLYAAVAQSAWVLAAPLQSLVLALKAVEEKQSKAAA